MQWREANGDNPLEVCLGETGQGSEVSVEETQAVVVVFQVQAAAHALGQLMDEAEVTVVVAGSDPVKHGGMNLDADVLAHETFDVDVELNSLTSDREFH